jgi:hypothetical protein
MDRLNLFAIARLHPNAFSPQTWGWTGLSGLGRAEPGILPTDVGMDRLNLFAIARLHPNAFSPQTWGWTAESFCHCSASSQCILPTDVGMDRLNYCFKKFFTHSPHRRGDGPDIETQKIDLDKFSPQTWGWTVCQLVTGLYLGILPTDVGMDR